MSNPNSSLPPIPPSGWLYASLEVLDGERRLKPTHFAFDRIVFNAPPGLTSQKVEIILTNGDETQRHMATVLPHDSSATRIPIRLHPPHQTR